MKKVLKRKGPLNNCAYNLNRSTYMIYLLQVNSVRSVYHKIYQSKFIIMCLSLNNHQAVYSIIYE